VQNAILDFLEIVRQLKSLIFGRLRFDWSNPQIIIYSISLITKLFKIVFIKALQNKFKNIKYMHGWLVLIELHGTWFLEIAQHQLVITMIPIDCKITDVSIYL